MKRKYQNGQEIINRKGLKFIREYDFYKIIIIRKEKARKTDRCPKYRCAVYMKENDNYGQTWIITETELDKFSI